MDNEVVKNLGVSKVPMESDGVRFNKFVMGMTPEEFAVYLSSLSEEDKKQANYTYSNEYSELYHSQWNEVARLREETKLSLPAAIKLTGLSKETSDKITFYDCGYVRTVVGVMGFKVWTMNSTELEFYNHIKGLDGPAKVEAFNDRMDAVEECKEQVNYEVQRLVEEEEYDSKEVGKALGLSDEEIEDMYEFYNYEEEVEDDSNDWEWCLPDGDGLYHPPPD